MKTFLKVILIILGFVGAFAIDWVIASITKEYGNMGNMGIIYMFILLWLGARSDRKKEENKEVEEWQNTI